MIASSTTDRQVLIERTFDAPRAAAFAAWTSPERLARWFAPPGCRLEIREFAFRQGGEFLTCIHTPDGKECWCRGVYGTIVPNERIEFSMIATDASGAPAEPGSLGMDPDWPRETRVIVTFEDDGAGSKLTLRQAVSEALARKTGAYPSWLAMFDELAAELARSA